MAAPQVVVEGGGTYGVHGHIFETGATPCDDPHVLEHVRNEELEWVYVVEPEDDDVEASPPGEGSQSEGPASQEAAAPPAEPSLPTSAEQADQREDGVEPITVPVEGALTTADAFKGPLNETSVKKEDAAPVEGFPCGDCDRVFKNAGGLASHRRSAHEE